MAVHHRHVGQSVPRAEGRDKVSGRATYASDVGLPGMLWGKALRSPVPHGRIRRIDTSRAERLEGVKAVVTAVDVRRVLERVGELMEAPVERLSVSRGSVVRTGGAGRLGYGEIVRAVGSPVSAERVFTAASTSRSATNHPPPGWR